MTTTPTSGAADLLAMVSKALREAYNLGQRYWQQADSEYISQHKKADDTRAKFLALTEETCATLAAGQATAAQAVVQDDPITIRKPTTSAEMLWLLKLAHLVISDVDKTLEETFSPAQPAAQQGVAYAALPDEREMLKHALWLASAFTVHCYLMSNAEGLWNGAEKATCHEELCCLYVAVFRGVEVDQVRVDLEADWMAVHDATQELTDHMDVVIGFPLKGVPDYEALAPKFFDHFHRLATHALRASHGQAPAEPDQPIACSYGDNGYACCEGGPCQADVHNDKLAEQPAPATQQAGESVYAFRRKGLDDFCTCDEARYEELSNKPRLFETRIFYTAPQPSHGQAPAGAGMGHTDGGRNMFYKGRFDGESQRERQARLRWANDMRAAFERHTGNGWFDKDWRTETGLWSSAWHACLAAQPTPPAQAADSVQEDAARYRWLREGNDAKHGAAWHVAVNLYGCEWDAAIDAAIKRGATQ